MIVVARVSPNAGQPFKRRVSSNQDTLAPVTVDYRERITS